MIYQQGLQVGFESIYIDRSDRMWLGIENVGLLSMSSALSNPIIYKHLESQGNSISSNSITTMLEDTSGDLWVGTQWAGINVIHYTNQVFKSYQLSHPITFQMVEDIDNKVWICTDGGGLCRFDPLTSEFDVFTKENSGLGANEATTVFLTSDNEIVVGCWNGGLSKFDRGQQKFTSFHPPSSRFNRARVFDLDEDGSGSILAALSEGGLQVFESEIKDGYDLLQGSDYQDEVFVEQIEVGRDGSIYMGGYRGLEVYDPKKDTHVLYEHLYDRNSISDNFIYCFFQENDSILWIGTGFGLNRFNMETERFQNFFISDGLPSNAIKAITKDDDGFIWISTNSGLSRLDYSQNSFKNFGIEDGLQGPQFTKNSVLNASIGTIYFGGKNGFTLFNPSKIQSATYKPKFVFTDFEILNEKVVADMNSPLIDHIDDTEAITLKHWQSFFSISFASLNFITSEKTAFKYKLEGFDVDWITSRENHVHYTNVDPGSYLFRVSSAYDGVWDEEERQIAITILPPWWQTITFRVAIVLILITSVIAYNRWRYTSLRRSKMLLEGQVSSRTEKLNEALQNLKMTQKKLVETEKMATINTIVAGMAHELNNPLNFIQGGKELLEIELSKENKKLNREAIKSYLGAINEGVGRAAGVVAGLEHFSLNPNRKEGSCAIGQILNEVIKEIDSNKKHNIVFDIEIEEGLPKLSGNRQELSQLFFNIIRNSMDSIDGTGRINVVAQSVNDYLYVIVKDNGLGMNNEVLKNVIDPFFTTKEPGQGLGLGASLAYKIVENHRGEIRFRSKENKGTTVLMKFPVERGLYQ